MQVFIDGLKTLGSLADADTLVYIAIGLFIILIIYEIAMMFVMKAIKKKGSCVCNLRQIDSTRRGVALTAAWLYGLFALLNTLPLEAGIKETKFTDIMIPVMFLLVFYVIELIFMIMNLRRCHAKCNCKVEGGIKDNENEKAVRQSDSKDKNKKNEMPALSSRDRLSGSGRDKFSGRSVSESVKTGAAASDNKAVNRFNPTRLSAKQPVKKENLDAKLDRQRRQAEENIVRNNVASSPQGTAAKMDELQRKMAELRQTVKPDAAHIVTPNQQQKPKRSVAELKQEHAGIKQQYERLQVKLEEMKKVRYQQEDAQRAKVGYYSDQTKFEKTGESQDLPALPQNSKFDEEQVMRALEGLKRAMDELQRQIDADAEASY